MDCIIFMHVHVYYIILLSTVVKNYSCKEFELYVDEACIIFVILPLMKMQPLLTTQAFAEWISSFMIQWNLVITSSDITKPSTKQNNFTGKSSLYLFPPSPDITS